MPHESAYDLECARANVEGSVRDFVEGAKLLRNSDGEDPRAIAEQLMMIEGLAQSLRDDIHDIAESLRKAVVALPDGIFADDSLAGPAR